MFVIESARREHDIGEYAKSGRACAAAREIIGHVRSHQEGHEQLQIRKSDAEKVLQVELFPGT